MSMPMLTFQFNRQSTFYNFPSSQDVIELIYTHMHMYLMKQRSWTAGRGWGREYKRIVKHIIYSPRHPEFIHRASVKFVSTESAIMTIDDWPDMDFLCYQIEWAVINRMLSKTIRLGQFSHSIQFQRFWLYCYSLACIVLWSILIVTGSKECTYSLFCFDGWLSFGTLHEIEKRLQDH